MKSAISRLALERPRTLDEALAAMATPEAERPVPIAGGTDLYVYLNAGQLAATRFLDLSRLRELRGIRAGAAAVTIGAATSFAAIRAHEAIRRRLPSLARAASEVGAWQIQERATLGGNIANASPAGDSLPALLAHDALVHARSVSGERTIPMDELFVGYRKLALVPGELILAVTLPWPPPRAFTFFRKVGTRRAQSISKVVFAALLRRGRDRTFDQVRLAWGSMAAVTKRATQAEHALLGTRGTPADAERALEALATDFTPIDDIRSEADYRRDVAARLLEQCLRAERSVRLR